MTPGRAVLAVLAVAAAAIGAGVLVDRLAADLSLIPHETYHTACPYCGPGKHVAPPEFPS